MRRDQLEHAIRAACQITGQTEVIVIGSQAILGTYPEYELPERATSSLEVDILPITDDNHTTIELADLIVGVAGELSPFEQLHGFSIDGVDLTTAALPDGWRDRLVKVQNANTAHSSGHPQFVGWCLNKEDLCVAKLCALRLKDQNFVQALIQARLVDPVVIKDRLAAVDARYSSAVENAARWLEYEIDGAGQPDGPS
jgi:hypothetical protein